MRELVKLKIRLLCNLGEVSLVLFMLYFQVECALSWVGAEVHRCTDLQGSVLTSGSAATVRLTMCAVLDTLHVAKCNVQASSDDCHFALLIVAYLSLLITSWRQNGSSWFLKQYGWLRLLEKGLPSFNIGAEGLLRIGAWHVNSTLWPCGMWVALVMKP